MNNLKQNRFINLIKLNLVFFLLVSCFNLFGNNNEMENNSNFGLHSIKFVQNSINVSRSDVTVFFSLRAFSQFGLNRVIIFLSSPSGKETIETSCVNRKKTKVGLLLGRILFKKKSEIGEWKINKIVIEDSNGDSQTFSKEFLINNNFTNSIQIKGKKL